jgi:uncharacterized membrane protein YfcA
MNLLETFKYISQAPFFWGSMGMITGIGMFIGSIIYNGDVNSMVKAIVTLFVYITLLTSMNITRIYDVYYNIGIQDPARAFGGILTSLVVSSFYIFGMYLGVFITKKVRTNQIKGLN